jgi:hypothetical protein
VIKNINNIAAKNVVKIRGNKRINRNQVKEILIQQEGLMILQVKCC